MNMPTFEVKRKITSYRINIKGRSIKVIRGNMEKALMKIGLFHKFSTYNYAFHINSTSGTFLLIRIKFNDYNDKLDRYNFEKLLKKSKIKFKVSEETFNEEMVACCLGSRMADWIKVYNIREESDVAIHQMLNCLGYNYVDEISFYLKKAGIILDGLKRRK